MLGFARRRSPAAPRRIREGLALSPNEERYVLSDIMSSRVYGNAWTVRIRGPLDMPRLHAAIRGVCDRHEARRTGYEAAEDGRFTRYVEAEGRPAITSISMPAASPAQLRTKVRSWLFERGDLTPPDLNRFLMIEVSPDDHVFGSNFHHATTDGETHRATLAEIFERYAGDAPSTAAVQYSDLWDWDWANSPAYRKAEAHWREALSGIDDAGALPEDGGDTGTGEWDGPVRVGFPADLAAHARAAAAHIGVSEFTFHYAVALVLLTRLTGERRVCSTFQSSGRRVVPGSQGVHGVFSNGLLLATEVDETQSIEALVSRLRGEIRAALEHEIYPYHHVIRATGLRPRFGVNWFPELPSFESPGLDISDVDMSYGAFEYDLNLRFVRDARTGGLDLVVFFREEAFSRARVEALARHYGLLLARLVERSHDPIRDVRSCELAPAGLLPDPATPLPEGGGELIDDRFRRHAAASPDAIAIEHQGSTWTYAEVDRRAAALARRLADAGLGPGDRVAILAQRRPELIWGMLAAARVGATFALLDGAYPEGRLATLLDVAVPQALLLVGPATPETERLASIRDLPLILADAGKTSSAPEEVRRPLPDDPAYILFTSGSTGRPKGVVATHRPLARFVAWHAEASGFAVGDRFSLLSGLGHDPMLRDVFTPLSVGATLVIPDAATVSRPETLATWLRDARITVAHMTPAHGQILVAGTRGGRGLPDLRHIFWGGDRLSPALVAELAAAAPGARQTNFYGATETPQAVGAFPCEAPHPGRAVPVGFGVDHAQLLVVGEDGRQLGVGEAGEIAVRSNYLSLGYLQDGCVVTPSDRAMDGLGRPNIYRTGDRGLHLPDGGVLLLGRSDDQVKVRGRRVDLTEIATALESHPLVGEAVVLAADTDVQPEIRAFVTARGGGATPASADLRSFLAGRLPDYMWPRAILVLDALPLLPSGKPDRRALAAVQSAEPAPVEGPGRPNDTERTLIEKWSAVLGEPSVSRESSFASLGGDSLSYVRAYLATEEVLGTVPTGWHVKPIAELAAAKPAPATFWRMIDTPMLVRAISIVLVVVGHMHLFAYGGGATVGLMMVSGFLLGSFQLSEAFAARSPEPVLKGLRRLLLPTVLFTTALFTAKEIAGKNPNPSLLFLYSNIEDYSKYTPPYYGGHEFYLWYICCMVQIMAAISIILLLLRYIDGYRIGARGFALIMFVAGCIGRFLAPALFIPNFFIGGVAPLTMVHYLPSTHLPTLMLGALIAMARTRREHLITFGLLGAYAAATMQVYGVQQGLVLLAAGTLIATVRRLPLPGPLTALALALSGASLFIYLTHFIFRGVLRAAGAPNWPLLHVMVALAGGVVVWAVWVRAGSILARTFRRPAGAATPAVT